MKRFFIFPYFLCAVIGLLVGILLPVDWREDPVPSNPPVLTPATSTSGSTSGASSDAQPEALDPSDNFSLLNIACAVNGALRDRDYATLASYVHPQMGVTFTPYSTVDPDSDLTFTPAQIRDLKGDDTVYTWGTEDGRGLPIQMTMVQYLDRYVYDTDYTQAPEIGIDRIITSGNALENLSEAYPDCRFVDFSFPSADPVNDGLDWSSLKLVFYPEASRWYLVGIVHGEWTI